MTNAIDHLLAEHEAIMAALAPLRRAMETLHREGDAALPGAYAALEAAGGMMGDRLLRHARKEDDVLFPALEEALGGGGPTAVMREEHREIHAQAELFRRTLRELHQIEHPAIAAGGAAIRELTRRGASSRELEEVGAEIVRSLDLHFAKEEEVLFPMARNLLPEAELAEMGRRMAALDP